MKIVMIDQDGVVCNKDYQSTCDLSPEIFKCINEGVLLIPNSDTPVKRLIDNFKALIGLVPEIIVGEKGSAVLYKGELHKTNDSGNISEFVDSVIKFFGQEECVIKLGDSATWIRERRKFKASTKIVLIDAFRKHSAAFYVLRTDENGIPQIDLEWFEYASQKVKQLKTPHGFNDWDINLKYGIVILHSDKTSKTQGYKFLKKIFPYAEFFMIGDADIDIIDDHEVVHCAVANASDNLKKASAYCSQSSYTEGLRDSLQWILNS